MSSPTLHTTGSIAKRLDQPLHRVEYVIRTRGVVPIGLAGNAKVYSQESFDAIAVEIKRIDAARAAETAALRPRRVAAVAPELVGSGS